MVQSLSVCRACGCHVHRVDADCPHCGASMRAGKPSASTVAMLAGLSTASFVAACGDEDEPAPNPPVNPDTSTTSTGMQVIAAYGVGGFPGSGGASTGDGGDGADGGMGGMGGMGGGN